MALIGASATLALAAPGASAVPLHIMAGQFAQPPTTAQCEAQLGIACYDPQQFQQAYDMNPLYHAGLTGAGRTIVIVDSFGSPTIQQDLQTFDQTFGLPAPPSLKIIQPAGQVPPYDPTDSQQPGWGVETSLDVEYAHTMAPGANILLVETPVAETEGTTGLPQIVEAENYVINHHLGDVITQSFGATEETFPSAQSIYRLRGAFFNALVHRVTVLGSSGDAGPTDYTSAPDQSDLYPFRVNSWPSSDPLVTSVGGTQLHLDASGNRTAADNVWNDTPLFGSPAASGGGTSAVFSRPFYQDEVASTVGRSRGTPDVSMSAAVDGGAIVYWSFPGDGTPGYHIVGGTSEASPLFSGVVAIADQASHHDLGLLNPTLYSRSSALSDVTGGDTTVSFTNPAGDPYPGPHTVLGYNAVPGYDLATGLGTADGVKFVSALASDRGERSRHGGHR
ncbi:MAG: S53 family peptidase [Solirubrobacteraceae bacterium]